MPAPEPRWSGAFLRQAQSDLDAYEVLFVTSLPSCHRLHYLQMWLEKLCKAYLWSAATTEINLPEFRTSHNVIAKVLPALIREHWRSVGYVSEPDFRQIRALCREVDRLHPQLDDGGARPDNGEYPWAVFRDGTALVVAPADEAFKIADRISNHVGRQVMKAAIVLTRRPTIWRPGETA
jgi:hypothetical protein